MEEIEVPIESVQEDLHHHAEHSPDRWVSRVALSSALFAALAAVAALLAGHHSNEAMIEQIQASDHWSHYQAKSVKSAILNTKIGILSALDRKAEPKDQEKLGELKNEQKELMEQANEKESSSRHHLTTHQLLARAVTFFQVAIALSAISVLTRRRRFWHVSLIFGLCGTASLIHGLIQGYI